MSAFAFVQAKSGSATATLAFTADVTAGDLILVFVGDVNSTYIAANTPTDNNPGGSNHYDFSGQYVGSNLSWGTVFIATAQTTGPLTITLAGFTGAKQTWMIAEYSVPASQRYIISFIGETFNGLGTDLFVFNAFSRIPDGLEYMAISFVWDVGSSHTWTLSGGGTIRGTQDSSDTTATMVFTDFDIVGNEGAGTDLLHYVADLGGADAANSDMLGLQFVLIEMALPAGGSYAYAG